MKNNTLVSFKEVIKNMSIDEAIKTHKEMQLSYPERPIKPHLSFKHTSQEVRKYTDDLAAYEIEIESYKKNKKDIKNVNSLMNGVMQDFIIDYVGLKGHPKADKAWAKAYEDGRSYGFYEIYLKLESLTDLILN